MKIIALFASGSGTNAENLMNYFGGRDDIRVGVVLTNNPKAGVIGRAQAARVPVRIFARDDFYTTENVLNILAEYHVDYIVLAGFLWLVPGNLIEKFPRRILNIHPALLPAYGGKGMYGMNVHRAVIANKEKWSGITIHEIDNEYDRGETVFHATCEVSPEDTPETLAEKIHLLEYQYLPEVVENWVQKKQG